MKNLQKLAGISILLILIFMTAALYQYYNEEEESMLQDGIEYFFNDGWLEASLDSTSLSEADLSDQDRMIELMQQKLSEDDCQTVSLPYKGKSGDGDIVILKNTLPAEYTGCIMKFSTAADTGVQVILDKEVIYQSGAYNTAENHTGTNGNMVKLPYGVQAGELWIVLKSARPDAAAALESIAVESMIIGVIGSSISDVGCCLLIVLMAVIMFVYELIRRYTGQPVIGEFYLGLAGLAAGAYYFIKTDTLIMLYDLQEANVIQDYLFLMFPILLTMYFLWNLNTVDLSRFSVLLWCTVVNAAAQILMQAAGVCTLQELSVITNAVVCLVCIVSIVSLIQMDGRKKSSQTALAVIALFVLMAGIIINVIINTFDEYVRGDLAGQYGMTVFSVMVAVKHTFQLFREYQAKAEEHARLLKEQVVTAEQQNMQLALAKKEADAARHEALAANEAKGKFLAHMSHEIRTPINAVLGMDEMILRESKEQTIKEYAMDIYTAGQTLLSLINDILDFSKIESGKMEIVPVEYDISSMIHDLANMASQRAEGKNIKLEVEVSCEIPSRLYGDDVRIRQILTNILTNAVKYTHKGNVWLRVQGSKKDGTALLKFEIEDTGIGIRKEDLPRLSAEFERIEEDKNRNIEGTGLGMSITNQLLALLGSRLYVESEYGKGSIFRFELEQKIVDDTPVGDFESRVQQIAEKYQYSSKFCAPDAKILVVDDNAVNRRVLRNLLKETQIQVTDADGGAQCLSLVQEQHFDLIFLDHMMPDMDGVETLHHIKELSDFPCQDTPIVVLTANAVSGAKEKYLSEGFDDFLSKPIVPDKLENMIQKMLPENLLKGAAGGEQTEMSQQTVEQAEEFLEEMPQVDGLDWELAWRHLPDRELLEYTVKEFYIQIESAADRLERAFEQADELGQLEQYRIQVHAMKSLAATIGIMPLSGIAKILEYAARDGRVDIVMSVTPVFLEEWRSYIQKLRGVFGIEAEAKKEMTDVSVIQALVEMVRLSMQEMDIDRADQLVGELRAYEYEEELGRNIQRLAEAVTNLDADETDRIADLLMKSCQQAAL